MKRIIVLFVLFLSTDAGAQQWSQELARTAMSLWKDSFALQPGKPVKWSYDQGVILKGIEGVWMATGEGAYFDYIRRCMDFYVQPDGTIKKYRPDDFNIDHINNGKLLLTLYRVTGKEHYKKAAALLRQQLLRHPRTSGGGFWHKKIYPSQMWLDGLYMGQPFYAEYAALFGEDTAFNDIARQFILMERHARDPKTGLLYHGWDESRAQQWADKATGRSPNVWGRALGWYGMALVDALEHFPDRHPGRDSLIGILNRFARAVTSVQDKTTGLWFDVPDKPQEPGNYVEASASAMLVYTLAKGMRLGWLPATYRAPAQQAYAGILERFIRRENGQVNLHGTVQVSGLGGKPYRDGSFAYYMSEPVIVNDPKGMGAFIKAAVEMEMLPALANGAGRTVLLDQFFNNEWKERDGRTVRHHYTWEDRSNGGFSLLGELFRRQGARTAALSDAPTAARLKGASVYLIVDPDTEKETPDPNYITSRQVKAISRWVRKGGVLVLLGNDSGNAEFRHFNKLASAFGLRFREESRNRVQGNRFSEGAVAVPSGHPIFTSGGTLYIKELAPLEVQRPAAATLEQGGAVVMAVAPFGKGKVLAVGDPWLYNEYLDGRKLPKDYTNHRAATELVSWLLAHTRPQ